MAANMHLLNPPSDGEIFFLKTHDGFYKIEVTDTVLSESKESMMVNYSVFLDPLNDPEWKTSGLLSLHHWNCWLRDRALVKITSPQDELAFIIKHSYGT